MTKESKLREKATQKEATQQKKKDKSHLQNSFRFKLLTIMIPTTKNVRMLPNKGAVVRIIIIMIKIID